MQKKRHIIVIGAGASGMMAAVTAAREGCRVTILERTSKSGRKIELTGSGKCNFTNENQALSNYHTTSPDYVRDILGQFSHRQTLAFFEELGIVPKCRDGYYYPQSAQAQAISQALRQEAERLGVKFACNIMVERIEKDRQFAIQTRGYCYEADALIIAAGSMAAPATGSDGSGYALAGQLGHQVKKPLPALVQLLSTDKRLPKLAGLRMEADAVLLVDGAVCAREHGEVQFIKNGLSGIPVFQVSGQAARALDAGKAVMLQIRPSAGTEALEDRRARLGYKSLNTFFTGMYHEKYIKAALDGMKADKNAGIDAPGGTKTEKNARVGIPGGTKTDKNARVDALNEEQWKSLCQEVQDMTFSISKTNGFEHAQVCSGGVLLEELKEKTLESKKTEQLYFAGEILDVDGACGGYNLQWAWASGYVAGLHAAKGG